LKKLRQQDIEKMEEMRKKMEKGKVKIYVSGFYREIEKTGGEVEGEREGKGKVTLKRIETW
jgi:hypothetical protein